MKRFVNAPLGHQRRWSRVADRFDREQPYDAMLRINCELAAENVLSKGRRFLEVYKANFDPNQPRWPRGSGEISGRWRPGDGSTSGGLAPADDRPAPIRLASADDRPSPPGAGFRFAAQFALNLIRNFRQANNLLDLFGSEEGSTVAVTRFNDKFIYGVNSASQNIRVPIPR
jgi:hypothetical protein